MLPGFNHNIRYRERLFHVQTEDNGLQQPVLVTQVFIGGHVVAVERTPYDDLLVQPDESARAHHVKQRMQEQHKRLLKQLVGGELDHRIASFTAEGAEIAPEEPLSEVDRQLPASVLQAAESLPVAPPDLPDRLRREAPTVPHPVARTSVLRNAPVPSPPMDDVAFEEIVGSLEEWEGPGATDPTETIRTTGRAPPPGSSPETTLPVPPGHAPGPPPARAEAPNPGPASGPAIRRLEGPTVEPPESDELPTVDHPPAHEAPDSVRTRKDIPAAQPQRRPSDFGVQVTPAASGEGAAPTKPRRPAVQAQDTVVDMQLPAALRAAQNKIRNRPTSSAPPAAPSLRRVEVHDARNRPAQPPPKRPAPTRRNIPSQDQTMLEMDPLALREALAKQRAKLEAQRKKTPAPKDSESRIVVSEPSLDEVIMSYLKDEE
jgi:hypothetical protein